MENTKDISAELKQFFPISVIKWRVGLRSGDAASGQLGQALPYIDARDVQERLDAVVGAGNWENMMKPSSVGVVCGIRILIDGNWVLKEDGAHVDEYRSGAENNAKELAVKGAFSDAFKRAAVLWGIGRYLYAYTAEMVPLTPEGHFVTEPTLPAHLMLEADVAALNAASDGASLESEAAAAADKVAADKAAADKVAADKAAADKVAADKAAADKVAADKAAADKVAADKAAADKVAADKAAADKAAADKVAADKAVADKAAADKVAADKAAADKAEADAAAQANAAADQDAAERRARADAMADSAAGVVAPATPSVASEEAQGADMYDFSHLTLTDAQRTVTDEMVKKIKGTFPFLVMHQYLSTRAAAKVPAEALSWLVALNLNTKANDAERAQYKLPA